MTNCGPRTARGCRRSGRAMGVAVVTGLPVVDISGLRSGSDTDLAAVADELRTVAHDVGFCYLAGTGIPDATFDRLLEVTKTFFALPAENKMRTYIGLSTCHRGYVPAGEEMTYDDTVDLKEAFDTALDLPADDPDYLAGNPMLGPNTWPECRGLRRGRHRLLHAGSRWGTCCSGRSPSPSARTPTFTATPTKTPSQLRLVYYPFDPDAVDALGIGAHTDYECFTLLKPTAPGLEVLNGAGEWIDVPPVPARSS